MRIAMIGTRGVPARYGGFETCLEEVGKRLVGMGHQVLVFGRSSHADRPLTHHGMRLVWLPVIPRRSLETLSHSLLSVLHPALAGVDVSFLFNAANAPVLPALRARRIPVATHVDGLEWQRAKWGALGQRYYRGAESLSVRWSDALIADARGIADYYRVEFGAPTRLIAYGAPVLTEGHPADRLSEVGVAPGGYHLIVARFEPENHVAELVEGYLRSTATKPLIVVGSAPYAEAYTSRVRTLAGDRVRLLGSVWDSALLDQLYAHAYSYLHGHSVGGTNPSLLRAAGAATYVIAWDVGFNREVLGGCAAYVDTPTAAAGAIEAAERDPDSTASSARAGQAAMARYDWDDVAREYERLAQDLRHRRLPLSRASGRRRST